MRYRCPKCGSDDLSVNMLIRIRLQYMAGEQHTILDDFEQIPSAREINSDDQMECNNEDCEWIGNAEHFMQEDGKP